MAVDVKRSTTLRVYAPLGAFLLLGCPVLVTRDSSLVPVR
jgi:hypothetical protein